MIRINPFAGEATGTMTRRDKINYYLDIAETVLTRGTCMRRLYGAIIVKNDPDHFHWLCRRAPRPGQLHRFGLLAPGTGCRFPAGSGMNCAALFMLRQTRLSTRRGLI